jgi:hypothetical protein
VWKKFNTPINKALAAGIVTAIVGPLLAKFGPDSPYAQLITAGAALLLTFLAPKNKEQVNTDA